MEILNYQVLEDLFNGVNGKRLYLEVTNVDVRRLRDDRAEIQLGQDVAFVATATFRASGEVAKELGDRLKARHLASGDDLLVIGPDAELRSDKLEIDEDSVALWIQKHYQFAFLLNGAPSPAFRTIGAVRVATHTPQDHPEQMSLPWITRLNTAAVKDDYIDVDVQITALDAAPDPVVVPDAELILGFDDASDDSPAPVLATLELEVPGKLLDKVVGQAYVLALDAPDGVKLALRFSSLQDQARHKPPAKELAAPGGKPKH